MRVTDSNEGDQPRGTQTGARPKQQQPKKVLLEGQRLHAALFGRRERLPAEYKAKSFLSQNFCKNALV